MSREHIVEKISQDLAGKRTASDLSVIADSFVRYLVGDRKIALSRLKQLANKNFEGDLQSVVDAGGNEYNVLYDRMFVDIQKAIRKHLPI